MLCVSSCDYSIVEHHSKYSEDRKGQIAYLWDKVEKKNLEQAFYDV